MNNLKRLIRPTIYTGTSLRHSYTRQITILKPITRINSTKCRIDGNFSIAQFAKQYSTKPNNALSHFKKIAEYTGTTVERIADIIIFCGAAIGVGYGLKCVFSDKRNTSFSSTFCYCIMTVGLFGGIGMVTFSVLAHMPYVLTFTSICASTSLIAYIRNNNIHN